MSDDELGGWKPTTKVVFSDEDLVRHLRETRDQSSGRSGNWWTFFNALPEPERRRLEAEAQANGPRETPQ
ncbi:MAG TPA: hypothetical protein VF669_15610 [Tepidisphaeraceae bacterium]|jgi:hypothetical protein